MLKVASFFAGVGGIDLAFEQTGKFKTVYANEIDKSPIATFEENFNLKVDDRDIAEVKPEDIPEYDVMVAGFPCQPFSVAGYREGFSDEKGRGNLFFELVRIFLATNPEIIFLENVKNLVGHDNGNTFRVIIQELERAGYYSKYAVLNSMYYGNIPQNRERIYIVSFKDEEACQRFTFPMPVKLNTGLNEVIDFRSKENEKYYYREGKYKGDIYERLVAEMDDNRAIYQWRRKYVRKNKSGVIPTLTANQGEGGHNVCVVSTEHGIRKMTPRECFNAQGFPSSFKLPKELADSKLYKQAGNSVTVSTVRRIAEQIAIAIEI